VALRPVYSTRFYQVSLLVGSDSIVVTPGYIWIVRDIDVTNRTGGGSDQFIWFGPLNQVIWITYVSDDLAFHSAQWRGRQVFREGEAMTFDAGTGTWDVTVSGYALTLP
jgi:hypothetical protein